MTASGATTTEDKVGIMVTLDFQCHMNHLRIGNVAATRPYWYIMGYTLMYALLYREEWSPLYASLTNQYSVEWITIQSSSNQPLWNHWPVIDLLKSPNVVPLNTNKDVIYHALSLLDRIKLLSSSAKDVLAPGHYRNQWRLSPLDSKETWLPQISFRVIHFNTPQYIVGCQLDYKKQWSLHCESVDFISKAFEYIILNFVLCEANELMSCPRRPGQFLLPLGSPWCLFPDGCLCDRGPSNMLAYCTP